MRSLLVASLTLLAAVAASAADKPNVLIVMTDDQGMGDFSYYDNPFLKTPHFDAFAKESIRLTDFHACPMCTPTRGQLLTGQHALRTGATSVTAGRTFLRRGIPTMPEVFAQAGYKTGIFGKWHLGDHYPHRPMDRGFQECVYHMGWGMLHSTPEYGNPLIDGQYTHNGVRKPFHGHCTDLWFDRATAWMKARKGANEPFLCYLPTNAPHAPFQELKQYIEPYQGKKVPAGFFGMIAHVDARFGELDRFLTESGLRDNTIVVFTTDNGGTAGVNTFNAGLRAGKTTYYDGGHRVPCWVRWPAGQLGDPRNIDTPAQNVDLMPTLAEFCGVPLPQGAAVDGTSLASLLRGTGKLPDRKFVVQYSRDKVAKWDSCVVWNQWRLVKGEELYDVRADRAQKHEVAAQHADIVKAMRDHYESWWAGIEPRVNDYVPISLGAKPQPEVAMTSGDWENIYADNVGHVRTAVGGPTGGHWHVLIERPGEYTLTLRRWPRETHAALGSGQNDTGKLAEFGGKAYNAPAVKFPIAEGIVECAGKTATAKTAPTEQDVTVRLALPAGKTTLKAWFRDAAGKDLCGAFFVYVKKVE